MLTKDEEKALLAATIAGLPDGYLRDILIIETDVIHAVIDQDRGFIDLPKLVRLCREEEDRLSVLRRNRMALEAELRELDRQRQRLQDGLRELRSDARRLAGV